MRNGMRQETQLLLLDCSRRDRDVNASLTGLIAAI